MNDLSKCLVLVPYQDRIVPQTDEVLRELERRGVRMWRQPYCSAIDYCRSWMASDALHAGNESILFVDSDIEFRPDDAIRTLLRPEPIVVAAYAQKTRSPDGVLKVNCKFAADIEAQVTFGEGGGDYTALACGAGFMRITADALRHMVDVLDMPQCNGKKVYPFFLPSVICEPGSDWTYQGEDYSFCWRARKAGLTILCDTRVYLKHHGDYGYSWDDLSIKAPFHHPTRTILCRPGT